jgi:hypothetical protein
LTKGNVAKGYYLRMFKLLTVVRKNKCEKNVKKCENNVEKCGSCLLPLKACRATTPGKQKKKRLFTAPLYTTTRR